MALFTSHLISAASGSVGGLTFLGGRGGLLMRAKATPVDPSTPFQSTIRTATSYLVDRWTAILSPSARTQWATYARNVPLRNRLGILRNVGPLPMYLRSNLPRIAAELSVIDKAPNRYDLSSFTPIATAGALALFQSIRVAFNPLDSWTTEPNAAMLIYSSRPHNRSINNFRGSYRLAKRVDGDAAGPPTFPTRFQSPFPFRTAQRLSQTARVTRADGRLTAPQRITVIAT